MSITNQNPAQYEATAEDWHLNEQARRFDRTLELLREEKAGVPWIEFGSLAGGFAGRCADALGHPRASMWCCDFTPGLLQRASARGFSTCRWDLENEPRPAELRPGTFATILFCEIIEHLVAPDRTLKPVVELLAPGGMLLVTTPNLASLGNRFRLIRGHSPSLAPAPGVSVRATNSKAAFDHLRVCVTDEWVALLGALGLDVTRVEGCTSAPTRPASLRGRLSLGLNKLLERMPGAMWQTTMIVARARS